MLGPIWRITQNSIDNPSVLAPPDVQLSRAADIRRAVDTDGLHKIMDKISAYLAGRGSLTGLGLHYQIEICTPLILLNIILRKGYRNRYSNGLQQTYGDHTRLLMHGIDMLDSEHIEWFSNRCSPAGSVSSLEISDAVATYRSLCLSRADKCSLWLAAALHGKLYRHRYGLDADDAVSLCRPILETLVDPRDGHLVEFCIRNHDYIEHIPTGETPVSFICRQLACMPSTRLRTALSCLGIIQLVGATSLGEGRLTVWKTAIFQLLVDGSLVDDTSTSCRLARLLFGDRFFVDDEKRGIACRLLESLDQDERGGVEEFLSRVVLHGWAALSRGAMAPSSSPEVIDASWRLVRHIASIWTLHGSNCEHIALDVSIADKLRSDPKDGEIALTRICLLNGSRAIVIQAGIG
jgi:hypothetical protein